jgi:glycogen debranching enzyme
MDRKTLLKRDFINQSKIIFKKNTKKGYSRWKKTRYSFIAPSDTEYTYQFFWDTAFHAIVLSNYDPEWAKKELKNHLLAQWEDGFIPHIIFWDGNTMNLPHWAFIESEPSIRPYTSALTQPPVFSIAVEKIYEKSPDKTFLKEVLPKLAKYYRWLLQNRDPDRDFLVSIISPNESGMDELPVFQVVAGFLKEDYLRLRYYFRKPDLLNQRHRFNSTVILEKDYFNVEELMFNVCFIEGAKALSRLFKEIGGKDESEYFSNLAKNSQSVLLKKCWDEGDQIFYSLYSEREKKAKVKTIASLMPLFLSDLPKDKAEILIKKHLLNPAEFWTNYPIPSVAKSEPYYFPGHHPYFRGKLLWRGPSWINTNWFIIQGLRKNGFENIADQIIEKTLTMVEREGFREYYNPETGEGYRRENFAWSTLVLDLL